MSFPYYNVPKWTIEETDPITNSEEKTPVMGSQFDEKPVMGKIPCYLCSLFYSETYVSNIPMCSKCIKAHLIDRQFTDKRASISL